MTDTVQDLYGLLVIRPVNVRHVYSGRGQVAFDGYSEPHWLEGRLLEYENGCLSFVWFGLMG